MKLFLKISLAILVLIQALPNVSFAVYYQLTDSQLNAEKNDPYQSLYTPETLKAKFLRRITNDPDRLPGALDDTPFGENSRAEQWYSWPALDGWQAKNQVVIDDNYPKGKTLTTTSSADTQQLFRNIANRIKLKLVS